MMKYSRPRVTEITGRPKQGYCDNGSSAAADGCNAGGAFDSSEACFLGNDPTGDCMNGPNANNTASYCRNGSSPWGTGSACESGGSPTTP